MGGLTMRSALRKASIVAVWVLLIVKAPVFLVDAWVGDPITVWTALYFVMFALLGAIAVTFWDWGD